MSSRVWYEVAELDELAEGQVESAACGRETVCTAALAHDGPSLVEVVTDPVLL